MATKSGSRSNPPRAALCFAHAGFFFLVAVLTYPVTIYGNSLSIAWQKQAIKQAIIAIETSEKTKIAPIESGSHAQINRLHASQAIDGALLTLPSSVSFLLQPSLLPVLLRNMRQQQRTSLYLLRRYWEEL